MRGACELRRRNFGRHVQSPMAARLPPTCRLAQDGLSDTCKNVIGATFAVVMTRVVVCAV